MSLATQLKRSIRANRRAIKRSIRANRRAIKRALPFQGFDALARRTSFEHDMMVMGLCGLGVEAMHACLAFRFVALIQDPAVRYLPATGAP